MHNRILVIFIILAVAPFAWPVLSSAQIEVIPGNSLRGAALFREKGCVECHAFRGAGARLGPDLAQPNERTIRQCNWPLLSGTMAQGCGASRRTGESARHSMPRKLPPAGPNSRPAIWSVCSLICVAFPRQHRNPRYSSRVIPNKGISRLKEGA